MMTEARWPNGDDLFNVGTGLPCRPVPPFQNLSIQICRILIGLGRRFTPGVAQDPWDPQTSAGTAVSQTGQRAISLDSACYLAFICPTPGGYYYIFGILGALDTQREWFYDSATSTLYLSATR